MVAVDTNILVRLLTGDDSKQTAAARALFASEEIWIAKTVLIETAWVLWSSCGLEENAIANAFSKLLGLDNVQAEDEEAVAQALAWVGHGLELADAIHLCSRPAGAVFVSLDKALVRRARRAGVEGIQEASPAS